MVRMVFSCPDLRIAPGAPSFSDTRYSSAKICGEDLGSTKFFASSRIAAVPGPDNAARARSEEHTSELQSLTNLVCRLLLEKKKKIPDSVFKYWATKAAEDG